MVKASGQYSPFSKYVLSEFYLSGKLHLRFGFFFWGGCLNTSHIIPTFHFHHRMGKFELPFLHEVQNTGKYWTKMRLVLWYKLLSQWLCLPWLMYYMLFHIALKVFIWNCWFLELPNGLCLLQLLSLASPNSHPIQICFIVNVHLHQLDVESRQNQSQTKLWVLPRLQRETEHSPSSQTSNNMQACLFRDDWCHLVFL